MNISMYPKLAWGGIRKNKQLYLPYMLTSVGMVTMFYIVTSLADSIGDGSVRGGSTLFEILGLGSWVVAIFSAIFLFYTSSFLMRRRQREFGLYNILGMGKRHIGVIMLFETAITAVISISVGLLLGVTLAKLAEAALSRILEMEIGYRITVSVRAILMAIPLFAVIFIVILLSTLLRVRLSSPIALLHSEHAGERPPRTNPIIGVLGVILLAAAYYIAVTTENPIKALGLFFVAVIMVVIGTYALFVAGSVLLCRILQKNKSYYYKSENFISVSSMVFRMKRNGAGLASICILLTMVLVMITSTVCLYTSEEEILYRRNPREITGRVGIRDFGTFSDDDRIADVMSTLDRAVEDCGGEPENQFYFRIVSMMSVFQDGTAWMTNDLFLDSTLDQIVDVYLVPLRDYNRTVKENYTLADDEALVCFVRDSYDGDKITIGDIATYRIAGQVEEFIEVDEMISYIGSSIVLIVNDVDERFDSIRQYSSRYIYYGYDIADEKEDEVFEAIYENAPIDEREETDDYVGVGSISVSSRNRDRIDFYSLYGGIFFLGVMLSIVFILAAVLIIYYKQISEGYEDRSRFEIMQKVGLTDSDIKRSINSQMRTVFVLPIAAAGIHLCFAFPMLQRLLLMFGFANGQLLLLTACTCVGVIAAIYLIVYKLTAGAYYGIVSGK